MAATEVLESRCVHRFYLMKYLEMSLQYNKNADITKTCLYNLDPLKPHFYIVKLGFTGVYIISSPELCSG